MLAVYSPCIVENEVLECRRNTSDANSFSMEQTFRTIYSVPDNVQGPGDSVPQCQKTYILGGQTDHKQVKHPYLI